MLGTFASKSVTSDPLVLSPLEPLVAGGAAEALERQLQQLLRGGSRHLIVDLSGVTAIDSAGVRALVQGHTSALRLGGRLRLAALPPALATVLGLSNLGSVFDVYESVDAARVASWPWRKIRIVVAGALLCSALVWAGLRWPLELAGVSDGAGTTLTGANPPPHPIRPFIELLKLVAATLIGLLVTALHQPATRDRPHSMEQAQTLLCVA